MHHDIDTRFLRPSSLRRFIRRHLNEVRFQYEKVLAKTPGLAGRIVIQFTIGGDGHVLTATVQSSTLAHPGLELAIAQAVQRWEFPPVQGGGRVVVNYPFELRPSN